MGKWTLERWLTIGVFVFTLGANWGRVWSQQSEIDKLKAFNESTLAATYVRRDIYDINQQNLTDAIRKLTESLEKLYVLEQQTGEPARIQRQANRGMFDK